MPLVVCTGRSKSWAHFLLTHFHDLEYVISEGGGTLSYIEKREGRRLLKDKSYVEVSELERLGNLTTELLIEFPEVMLSADSFGRQADRAIELYELSDNPEMKEEVVAFFKKEDINFSTSNVHMNFWCGEISKMKAITTFLNDTKMANLEESIFFGDSLNDESVFKDHPRTIGVSNIKKVQDRFNHLPKEILVGSDKEGPLGVLSYLREVLK